MTDIANVLEKIMYSLAKPGLTLAALFFVATAQSQEGDHPKGERRGPPPVAIEACVAAVDGDVCSFAGRRGDALSGVCVIGRNDVLACQPERRRPEPPRGEEDPEEE